MMKKAGKLLIFALCAVMAAAMMTGCTMDFGEGGGGSSDLEMEIPELIINPDATTTIKVSTLVDEVEYGTMVYWANGYMRENTHIQIQVNNNLQAMSDLSKWKPNNQMPDICWTSGDQHAPYSKLGYFDDLTRYAVDDDADFFADFYSTLIDSTHMDDKDNGIWFVPRDYNKLVCYVNYSLLEENGITPPGNTWTWQDLLDICSQWRTKKTGDTNYALAADYTWNPLSVTLMRNYGASVYRDGKLALTKDTPEMRECMTDINQMVKDRILVREATAFYRYDTPMLIGVRPALPTVLAGTKDDEQDIRVLPFPSNREADNGTGYVGVGCSGYAICADSKFETKQASWEFLKYCISERGYEEVGGFGTITPALESLSDKGSWTNIYNGAGEKIDSSSYIGGLAEAISVNFCNNISPQNQGTVAMRFQSFFQSVQYPSFDYDREISTFLSAIGSVK